ncbi:MAG: hypothetical protein WC770_08855 [Phycisphaerae bacterium]|jgi:hypothetical protein
MSKNVALNVSGVVFILVALLHLARVIMKLNANIGQWEIPASASIGGFIFAGVLAVLMFTAAAKK